MIENKQFPQGKPLVSISCVTYNHEKYVRDCLEGFLIQETTFPFEVVIHDDASIDHTADIIREYAAKYPDIIKPYFETENCFQKGKRFTVSNYDRIQGKYLAICEGDDFWTDPHKLQKQFDYMEAHPDCSLCFHDVQQVYDDGIQVKVVPYPYYAGRKELKHVYPEWTIQPCSTFYRMDVIDLFLKIRNDKRFWGTNIVRYLLAARVGYLWGMEDVMACYRKNPGSISRMRISYNIYIRHCDALIEHFPEIADKAREEKLKFTYGKLRRFCHHCPEETDTVHQTLQEIATFHSPYLHLKVLLYYLKVFCTKVFRRFKRVIGNLFSSSKNRYSYCDFL